MNSILDSNQEYTKEVTRDFFKSVYMYMFMALAVSGIVAYMVGTPEFFVKHFVSADGLGVNALFWAVALAPLGLGVLMQMAYRRLSYGILLALYITYSVLMGLSLSTVLLFWSIDSAYILCSSGSIWWNGCFRIYDKNRFNQVWKPIVHGVHRNFYCRNCEHLDRKRCIGFRNSSYWSFCLHRIDSFLYADLEKSISGQCNNRC